jgi:hypothetical protein
LRVSREPGVAGTTLSIGDRETFLKQVAYAFVVVANLCSILCARAEVFDFSALRASPGGSLNQPDYTTANREVTVEAFFYQNGPNAYIQGPVIIGTSLVAARLFVRNDGGAALGLGVCTPYESNAGACSADTYAGGGGEINELDNTGTPEMIRLTLGEHYRWDAVWVSSLTGSERGQLRYSNDGTLSGQLPGGSFTSYVQLDPASATQRIALHGAAAAARYLYLLPGPAGTDNDHLLWKVQVTHMPEPSAVALLGLGLAPLVLAVRRRSATRRSAGTPV